ncbi:MAG: DUF433 domain-containing protein [Planctomycetes bacterium]|nr:DUF433 domain-containing protein [Planctomycetota bacterium]MBM4084928.1 DUF433 domain-containing protein [Planctomycetota bacterium]
MVAHQYVEQRDQGYWIAGSRVSLDSVILAFREGLSPETIAAECFPLLTLEQVYGAIAYYLAHRAEMDAYLQRGGTELEALRSASRAANPGFAEGLAVARRQGQKSRLG